MTAERTAVLRYERAGDLVRFSKVAMSNHEFREVMLGMWLRLDPADREDHIRMLVHYSTDPAAFLSDVAAAVAADPGDGATIDLLALAARGERIRP